MNRIEYMTKLASLLQDIPEVERRDAMKYYKYIYFVLETKTIKMFQISKHEQKQS